MPGGGAGPGPGWPALRVSSFLRAELNRPRNSPEIRSNVKHEETEKSVYLFSGSGGWRACVMDCAGLVVLFQGRPGL